MDHPTPPKKSLPTWFGQLGFGLLCLGIMLAVLGFKQEPQRFSFNYLVMFLFLLGIGVGSLFLIALEYLVGATWSTPLRRVTEIAASILSFRTPALLILSVPLFLRFGDLYHHWLHPAPTDTVLMGKHAYLNFSFFVVRFIFCIAVWAIFYEWIVGNSQKQDSSGDPHLTEKNETLSALFMPFFAITISMSGMDWAMSLDPHWYSTMYGVYFFTGSMISALAITTIFTVFFKENGFLHRGVVNDHLYSLGALLFGMNCFWGYVAFSQYMLIWYANIPEETGWFLLRWTGGWRGVSLLLIFVHFAVPFFGLLPRASKIHPPTLVFMSLWLLIAHALDLYWLVLPSYSGGVNLGWMEIGFMLIAGGFFVSLFHQKGRDLSLIPSGDPRLANGLEFRL